jgi:hypothetical protein
VKIYLLILNTHFHSGFRVEKQKLERYISHETRQKLIEKCGMLGGHFLIKTVGFSDENSLCRSFF